MIHYFRWGLPARLRQLLSEPLQRQLRDPSASAPLQDWLDQLPPSLSRLQQMLALEQRFFLADHNLHYTDAMSMAAGVEIRLPFLDPELVSLSWRLPMTSNNVVAVVNGFLRELWPVFSPTM